MAEQIGGDIKTTAIATSVYDVEDKKLIAVFRSQLLCAKYFSPSYKYNGWGYMNAYIRRKAKSHKNFFNRTVAFRTANAEQTKLLGGEEKIILDERYKK